MSRKSRRDSGFTCIHCRQTIDQETYGTRHRNHCPRCLWSRHVDDEPGDRRCPCRAPMSPVGVEVRRDGEWAIIHRCTGCSTLRTNRIAGDDAELALLQLALRPLVHPPFPLDLLTG
ncbi:MAG: RNHCP domain-containing protein [Phycisphaerales bacterium]|nr:RNHCP domain-containing protein [Phycisphaerales bacterium]